MTDDVVQAREKSHELQKLVGDEQQIVATFLLCLMEFIRDKMHERLGYASPWDFCRRGLGLCESTTGRRLKAIKTIERFPAVVAFLRDGRLCATRLLLLTDVLTPENVTDLLTRASRKSIKEIEFLVAAENPEPAPPVRIRKFPEPQAVPAPSPTLAFETPVPTPVDAVAAPRPSHPEPDPIAPVVPPAPNPLPLPHARRRSEVRPTSEQEYSARFPVSREWVGKLERAKKLGSHVVPTGDPVAILELALDLFIEKHGKRRGAIAPKRPRSGRPAPETVSAPDAPVCAPENARPAFPDAGATEEERLPKREDFSAEDRRAIWERDGGKCVWLLDSGERCESEWQLEVDHVDARAKGGSSDPRRARLLCRRHNDQHARETFGEDFMKAKKADAKSTRESRRVVSGVASSSGGGGDAFVPPDTIENRESQTGVG